MGDTEKNPVPPPFDEVPSVDSEVVRAAEQHDSILSSAWLRLALIVLFVAAIGFGQGLGLTLLFDRESSDLSVSGHKPAEKISSGGHAAPADDHETQPSVKEETEHAEGADSSQELTDVSSSHELEVARERFDMGDVEWARRTAAAFLLRVDGLGHEDTRRKSEAYALIADVLRHEYERSLRGSQQEELPEAGSQGEE